FQVPEYDHEGFRRGTEKHDRRESRRKSSPRSNRSERCLEFRFEILAVDQRSQRSNRRAAHHFRSDREATRIEVGGEAHFRAGPDRSKRQSEAHRKSSGNSGSISSHSAADRI